MKKILIITPYYDPEDFPINSFAQQLIKDENEVTVITGLPNYRNFSFYRGYSFLGPYKQIINNVKVLRVPIIPRYSNSKLSIFIFYLSYFLSTSIFLLFFSLIKRNKFDHMMSFCGSPVYVGLLTNFFSKIINCQNSQWVQDIWPEGIESTVGIKSNFLKKCINFLQNLMWNKSDILFAQSDDLSLFLSENTKCKKISTLYNPVRIENISRHKEFKSDKTIFSFMGTIGKGRSIESLIESFDSLNDSNIFLNICGDGPELTNLKKKYTSQNIIWHGWLNSNQLDEIAELSNFFIFGLENLGRQSHILPSKLQTYCMYGKPIICFSGGAPRNLILKNKIGFVSENFNKKDMIKTYKIAINSTHDERMTMSRNAINTFNNLFKSETTVKIFLNEIE